jgi:glycopeptide antibiotics resistance protein
MYKKEIKKKKKKKIHLNSIFYFYSISIRTITWNYLQLYLNVEKFPSQNL